MKYVCISTHLRKSPLSKNSNPTNYCRNRSRSLSFRRRLGRVLIFIDLITIPEYHDGGLFHSSACPNRILENLSSAYFLFFDYYDRRPAVTAKRQPTQRFVIFPVEKSSGDQIVLRLLVNYTNTKRVSGYVRLLTIAIYERGSADDNTVDVRCFFFFLSLRRWHTNTFGNDVTPSYNAAAELGFVAYGVQWTTHHHVRQRPSGGSNSGPVDGPGNFPTAPSPPSSYMIISLIETELQGEGKKNIIEINYRFRRNRGGEGGTFVLHKSNSSYIGEKKRLIIINIQNISIEILDTN